MHQTWQLWIIICLVQCSIPDLVKNLKDVSNVLNFIDNLITSKPELSYKDKKLKSSETLVIESQRIYFDDYI